MRLPRLTARRLAALLAVTGMATIGLLLISGPNGASFASLGIALIWLLCLATVLPFAAYAVSLSGFGSSRPDRPRRPPRLPRVTTRRLIEMIIVVAACVAIIQTQRRWISFHHEAAKPAVSREQGPRLPAQSVP